MTDAPERIWVKEGYDSWFGWGHWYRDNKGGGVEYVRAEREVYDYRTQSMVDDIEALRDDVDVLIAKLAKAEAERDAALLREQHANERAMQHLRRAERAEIASKNHAAFSHEWRTRAEAAEAALPAAYRLALADAVANACWADISVNTTVEVVTLETIRDLPTPTAADLAERLKEKDHD